MIKKGRMETKMLTFLKIVKMPTLRFGKPHGQDFTQLLWHNLSS
jgi:hypothetical protein